MRECGEMQCLGYHRLLPRVSSSHSSITESFTMKILCRHLGVLGLTICWIPKPISSVSIPPSHDIDLANRLPFNATVVDGSFLNLTSLGAIDPAFGFMPFFGEVKLAPVACLMNSVNAAFDLALQDFQGMMPATVYKLEDYPQVEISVFPDEEGNLMLRKYVVWGINIGIDLMIKNVKFTEAVFVMSYRGVEIGAVQYQAPGSTTSISAHSLDINLSAAQSEQNVSLLDNTLALINEPQFEAKFTLTGLVLTIYEIFYTTLDMLRELADYTRTVRIVNDTTYVRSAGLDIFTVDPNDPSRTFKNPPYFQAEWLVRAMAQIPAYMLKQRSFRELDIELYVDDIKVGLVFLRKRHSNGSRQSGLNSTIFR